MPPRMRVAILDDYQEVALTSTDWSVLKDRVSIDVYSNTIADEDKLAQRLKDYEIICAMRERTKFPASLLGKLPKLRLIATTGVRNAGIDIGYARANGIVVSGTGAGGNSTVEHIWALILAVARNISTDDGNVKRGLPQWQTSVPVGLHGKTLGLLGIAKAFGMNVIGWSPNLTPERAHNAGVQFAQTKEDLLLRSDFISLHLVLSERTRHILTQADFDIMKPTALLINTSRGPLVDETALIDAIRKKKISGAGLDVFDQEPLPIVHELRMLENITLTPHTGYVNDTNYEVISSFPANTRR
ncbi:hypothetical protein DXG03_009003 [Asterophora parasitica]|uniref:D-isomer specific 2-hydroxyacid dehydrogenase NAD-binding domain-containing protein n=1 Tax=Asterophora parasitica TaxID=117018 RepID=A0A9P7GHZ9_9AGAR|nr:hypothetical protein DXG03_009003 [Asterophora parasitica]